MDDLVSPRPKVMLNFDLPASSSAIRGEGSISTKNPGPEQQGLPKALALLLISCVTQRESLHLSGPRGQESAG